jgi:hypothetical protein
MTGGQGGNPNITLSHCIKRILSTDVEQLPAHYPTGSHGSGLRGLQINHLQRLANTFPGKPRHNPGTPNLSSTLSRHIGQSRPAGPIPRIHQKNALS